MAPLVERLPPLNALRAFESAARHLSFKKAAQELHVTPGAISHQIKLLEDHLGLPLFRRLTRALELTSEAQAMLPKVREGLESLAAAVERVRAREESLSLTVLAPPNFAARWLIPRLARFTHMHPNVELHIASRLSMIDARESGASGVAARDVPEDSPMVMVRFGSGRYPGAHVDELFSAAYVPVCSPKLLEGPHPLRRPQDLRYHTLIHDETVVEEGVRPSWPDWLEVIGVKEVDAMRGPRFSNASLALEAAIEGMGVTLAMKPLVEPDIAEGRLVVPFDLPATADFTYYLVTPETSAQNPSVTAFRQWLLDEAAPARRAAAHVR